METQRCLLPSQEGSENRKLNSVSITNEQGLLWFNPAATQHHTAILLLPPESTKGKQKKNATITYISTVQLFIQLIIQLPADQ